MSTDRVWPLAIIGEIRDQIANLAGRDDIRANPPSFVREHGNHCGTVKVFSLLYLGSPARPEEAAVFERSFA